MKKRKLLPTFLILIFLTLTIGGLDRVGTEAAGEKVVVVPVEETVEKGMHAFLKRAIAVAEKENAKAIILDIDTPGGAVDAAAGIGKLLSDTDIKTVAFVHKQALSAGAYIALNADEIYMVPGAVMGSAAIIDQNGNAAGKKAESYWHAAMKTAAEENGRDPIYSLAMADERVDLPEYGAGKGKLLTLTSSQAEKVGYSEGTVKNLDALLQEIGLEHAKMVKVEESFAEKVARFLTHPVVVPILMTIGTLGLVLELYSPGFGIPGFMGISALLLFFYGHLVAGFAGYESVILFAIGIVLVVLEFFVAGGIAGGIGFVSIISSFFLASGNVTHMAISLLIALAVSVLASILMIKVLGKRMRLFGKIVLADSTSTEKGYISNANRPELIGIEGITVTPLRPAGTIRIGEERIDVVSEGGFIQKDTVVTVIKTEGSRIVVREKD